MNDMQRLLDDESFRPAGEIDAAVSAEPGVYAIRLRDGTALPEPFETLLGERSSRLIYVGKATSLKAHMLGNELRGSGHGTFFRSIGAVLGYRPLSGSLAGKANKHNYSFQRPDRVAIVEWINANLEVSWFSLNIELVGPIEAALILERTPLLNIRGNPRWLLELSLLRAECIDLASTSAVTDRSQSHLSEAII